MITISTTILSVMSHPSQTQPDCLTDFSLQAARP
jgi:hypothetical protein